MPDWALCMIFNADETNMEAEEVNRVNRFLIDNHVIGVSIKKAEDGSDQEPYFSASNGIGGLACNVYDCDVLCEVKPTKNIE